MAHQFSQSPLKDQNRAAQTGRTPVRLTLTPHGNLPVGQLPYSSWRHHNSPARSPSFVGRATMYNNKDRTRQKGADRTNSVHIRITPTASSPLTKLFSPNKTVSSPQIIPGTSGVSVSTSEGLGGIPQSELVNRFHRMWPPNSPSAVESAQTTQSSPTAPSPNIMEVLQNRKRYQIGAICTCS